MGKVCLGTKKALHILNHKRTRGVIYFKSHFAHAKTKAPLKGLRASLKRHILPLVKEKGAYTGKALRDRGCIGYGAKHGRAIDTAIDKYISTGKLPKRVDPCAITVLRTLKGAGIKPVASQVHATDSRGKVATAIDLLCVENNEPLLLELKSTQFQEQFFKEKGTLLHSSPPLPYSDATAALLQSYIPSVWIKKDWKLEQPKTAVMVVGPGGFCKIVRPTKKLERIGDKYAEMLLDV